MTFEATLLDPDGWIRAPVGQVVVPGGVHGTAGVGSGDDPITVRVGPIGKNDLMCFARLPSHGLDDDALHAGAEPGFLVIGRFEKGDMTSRDPGNFIIWRSLEGICFLVAGHVGTLGWKSLQFQQKPLSASEVGLRYAPRMAVVLLDIDGTLLDAGGAGRAALVAAMRHELGPDIPEQQVAIAGRTDRGILRDLLKAYDLPGDEANFSRLLQLYLDHLPGELERATGRVLQGVPELLAALAKMEDVHLGLLTGNVAVAAQAKLQYYELQTPFAFGGFGDDHAERADVAAAAIADAERHLDQKVPPEQVVVVGDTLNDIRCARAVGAAVIAVETGFATPEELREEGADLQLADFANPHPVLEFIRSRRS